MKTSSRSRLPSFLARALFPSWRFFEEIGQVPRLLYRSSLGGVEFGPWQPVWKNAPRRWWNLFFNPRGNLLLAAHGVLERAMLEFAVAAEQSRDEIEDLVSYRLLLRSVQANADLARAQQFQFKIVLFSQEPGIDSQDLMISTIHSMGEL